MTHSGVTSPSGNVGDLGVSGEIGECRTGGAEAPSLLWRVIGLVGGDDSGGGSAFRGGSL